jgi:cytochrome c biogenesis protein CcdA
LLALILLVVSVGLADAVNPSTLAPALLIATAPDAVRRLAGFTVGVFLVSLAGGVAVVLGPGQLLLDAVPHPGAHAKAVAEVVGGVVLLGLAAALWLGRQAIARRLRPDPGEERADRGAFLLGAGIMAVELPTAVPYFAAVAAILASHSSVGVQLLLVLLYNVAFVAPLLALLLVRELLGDESTARLESVGAWLRERAPGLLAVLLAAAGVAVGTVGVVHLAGFGGHHGAPRAGPSRRALDFTGRPEVAPAAKLGSRLGLTRRVPARVRASCRRVSTQTRQHVVCPRLVPRRRLSHIPYAQAPAEVDADLYVLSFNNGTIRGTLHWMTGAGTTEAVNRQLIDDRVHETRDLRQPPRLRAD